VSLFLFRFFLYYFLITFVLACIFSMRLHHTFVRSQNGKRKARKPILLWYVQSGTSQLMKRLNNCGRFPTISSHDVDIQLGHRPHDSLAPGTYPNVSWSHFWHDAPVVLGRLLGNVRLKELRATTE
jgi:hypothetical protein